MIEVLYEDNHLIAVYKNASDLSQKDRTGDESLDGEIRKYIAEKYNKPGDVFLGVIHRLDRPVSGVLLYARTSKALARMNEVFRTREVRKTYLAITRERPPEDEAVVTHYLKKNEQQNKSYAFDNEVKGSKIASLSYRIAGRSERFFLLEIELLSGRHHQIRAQMAKLGCPLKGDLKYGYPRSNEDGSISLHARTLEFLHPVKKERVIIKAHFPAGDVWHLFSEVDV